METTKSDIFAFNWGDITMVADDGKISWRDIPLTGLDGKKDRLRFEEIYNPFIYKSLSARQNWRKGTHLTSTPTPHFWGNGNRPKSGPISKSINQLKSEPVEYLDKKGEKRPSDLISLEEMVQKTGLNPSTIRVYAWRKWIKRVNKLYSWASYVELQKRQAQQKAFNAKPQTLGRKAVAL